MKLIVEVVVGYMYKVLKNDLDTTPFRKEFAAIRHGDYFDFLNLVGKQIDFIVTYNRGVISKDTAITREEMDFSSLAKSGDSLLDFYSRCTKEFGTINDSDISDELFEKAALFELSLRMHVKNKRLIKDRLRLEEVINQIQVLNSLTDLETHTLHKARKFINLIKRPKKLKSSWNDVIADFEQANQLITQKGLTIV
jgi:hypothetical protein